MNAALAELFFALFLACGPTLLGVRFARPRRMPWWALVSLSVVAGWLLLNASVLFREAHAGCLAAQTSSVTIAPPERSYEWQCADEADPKVAALLLSVAYLIPWLALYCVAHLFRKLRKAVAVEPPNKSLERTRGR